MKKIILIGIFCTSIFPAFAGKDSLAWDVDTLYGTASYYSHKFDSCITASGEMYTHQKFSAASNNFKLNTWLRVTNLKNGRSIIVKINDRMHRKMAEKGRVIDLSQSAAAALGYMRGGLTKVMLEKVPKGTKK